MDGTIIAAFITGAFTGICGLGAVVLTQRGSRKREHESDWRKMKLEYYKEYVAAFSEASASGSNETARQRYRSAVNNLNLVAPTNILIALYAFQKQVTHIQQGNSHDDADALFNSLLHAMRNDCYPKLSKDNPNFRFLHLNAPL
jgi:hypothetical protein